MRYKNNIECFHNNNKLNEHHNVTSVHDYLCKNHITNNK